MFKELIGKTEFEEVRKLVDQQGLYLWDIKIPAEDGYVEYSYMRAGRYPEGQSSATAIHMTFYDSEGAPISGYSVGKYADGLWRLTP